MAGYIEVSKSFHALLDWHLDNGTRPTGDKDPPGTRWGDAEFGAAVGRAIRRTFTARAVSNWRRGVNPPRPKFFDDILRVLFGDSPRDEYKAWAEDLRSAYEAAKPRPPLREMQPTHAARRDTASWEPKRQPPSHDLPPEPQWEEAYRKLPVWNQFPVLVFCGRTTIDDAIRSELVESPLPRANVVSEPDMRTADLTLKEIRYPKARYPVLAPVPVDHVLSRITDGWTKLVIFGDAGDGKSTLLRVLAGTFLAEGRFPILVRAREWEESEFRSLRQYVEDPAGYFQSLTLGPPSSRALAKAGPFLWAKLEVGQASVLVDGLDEATRPETIGNALRALPGDPRVLVTSRRIQYRNALPNFKSLDLFPFDYDAQVRPYARARLGADAPAFLQRLDDDARVRALTGSGLMLAMLCTRFEQVRHWPSVELDLPLSRDELYDWATDYLLSEPEAVGRHKHVAYHTTDRIKLAILESVAFHSQFCDRRALNIPMSRIERSLAEVAGHTYPNKPERLRDLLEDIVQNSEVLTRSPGGVAYRFFHPSFQEYFAARYLANCWDKAEWSAWLRSGNRTDETGGGFQCPSCRFPLGSLAGIVGTDEFEETVLLLAGLLRDPQREAAILALAGKDLNMRLKILARCHSVHSDVTEDFLSVLRSGVIPNTMPLAAIAQMRAPQNLRAILVGIGTLVRDESEDVRELALIVIGSIARLDTEERIIGHLKDMLDDPKHRILAARVLGEFGKHAASDAILLALLRLLAVLRPDHWRDYDEHVVCARALCAVMGQSDFLTALSSLASCDGPVGEAAARVLRWYQLDAERSDAKRCYDTGKYEECVQHLRKLIDQDFEVPSLRCHLARVLIHLGLEDEAREQVDAAWSARTTASPSVVARVLWFKLAFALLANVDHAAILGELHDRLKNEEALGRWDIEPCLALLRPRLTPDGFKLLASAVRAINGHGTAIAD